VSIALVTGSTRGLGLATATALAEAGHTVVITGRDSEAVRATCATATAAGFTFDGITLDVLEPTSVASLAELIQNKYGKLDILANNAGIFPEATDPGPHEFSSVEMYCKTFETNVSGVVAVIEALLPLLRSSDAGRIVNVSLSETPIIVTSICPGWVQTDLAPDNHENAPHTPAAAAAAEIVVKAALLPANASSGTFIDVTGPVRW
jgi:NAD(P)-dependent dehydrogenase (short-subunit alcohol dehydrogenase family)